MSTPLSNKLEIFAADIYKASPSFRFCGIGESRGADESGEEGTLFAALMQILPVQTQWGYVAGSGANGHLRTTISSMSAAAGTTDSIAPGANLILAIPWSGATNYVIGDKARSGGVNYVCTADHTNHIPPNASFWSVMTNQLNPAPCTVLSHKSTAIEGEAGSFDFGNLHSPITHKIACSGGAGTFDVNEKITQTGSTATGTFVSESGGFVYLCRLTGTFNTTPVVTLTGANSGATRTAVTAVTAMPLGYGDPGNTNTDLSVPISSKMRMMRGGDPYLITDNWVRLLAWQTANSPADLRFLARRNGANYAPFTDGPDTNPATFAVGTGFKLLEDCKVSNKCAGRIGAYLGMTASGSKDLHFVAWGVYTNATAIAPSPTSPAGPRYMTLGRSAQTLENFALYLGDDWGNGTQPYCGATDGTAPQVAAAQANCQTVMSIMAGCDGTTGGPTHIAIYCCNRGTTYTYGGVTESAALGAGSSAVTASLYRRIIDRLNTIGTNLNGVKPKILIITPEVAAYDAEPYSNATVQNTIANARAAAGHQVSTEYDNVCHLNINPVVGPYPLDPIYRPMWMRPDTETAWVHQNALGGSYSLAAYVHSYLYAAYLGTSAGGGIPLTTYARTQPHPIVSRLR